MLGRVPRLLVVLALALSTLLSCRMLPVGWTGRQAGLASWYGPGFYGRHTASGTVYTGAALTAAHRSLPFGTMVRVTNLENGRRVVVVIDDRGPFIRGRVIDLSVTAARRLGMIRDGVVPVRIKVVEWAGGSEV
jgi:rare lipoprotein A